MRIDRGGLFRLAWTVVPKLPPRLVATSAGFIGRIVAAVNVPSVKQLAKNLEQLTGRAVSRQETADAVASYFRCFGQQFSLPGWSPELLKHSCRFKGADAVREMLQGGPVILALTHSGNWDLAGAWFCQNYGPLVTVAEKLEPPELFEEFVEYRESLGMEILGVGRGEKVFDRLVEQVRDRGVLVPLLADRDISGSGIRVKLGGGEALVAAGPAALALKLGRPLIAGHITYRKVDGRWSIQLHATEPIAPPKPQPEESDVEALTREWVRQVEPLMRAGFKDWHMMQKLYVDDLDAKRLEQAEARHRSEEEREGSQ